MAFVNAVILIAGVIGLGAAGYGLVTLAVNAWRHRRYLDIVVAIALMIATVCLLLAFGDRIVR